MRFGRHFFIHCGVFILFVLFAVFLTYPLIFHFSDTATGFGDELLISWIINWNIYAFTHNPFLLFDANTFFPFTNSLAFSEPFLTSSVLAYIPLYFFNEPIVATNFTLLSSLALVGFSMYLLVFYLTKDYLVSIFCGCMVIFSPVTLDKAVHLQMLSLQWVPLSILCFLAFLKQGKYIFLFLSCSFFLFQTYNSFLPGYFILFAWLFVSLFYYQRYGKAFLKRIKIKHMLTLIVSLFLILPIALPYYAVSREYGLVRDIRESVHLALQPEDLLYASSYSRLSPVLNLITGPGVFPEGDFKPGFIGFVFSALVIVVIFDFVTHFRKKEWYYKGFILPGLFGLVLSLGPALHLGRQTVHLPFVIPLPYALFYYLVPGFQGFRNSFRWEMLFVVCMAIAAGVFLHAQRKKWSRRKVTAVFLLLFLGVFWEFNPPMQFVTVPKREAFPPVYSYIDTLGEQIAVIEMPIYNWDMAPYAGEELLREYYSTVHFRKMVNGASGFSPPAWQAMVRGLLRDFPSNSSIARLRTMGVSYIIVHKDEYDVLHKDRFAVGENVVQDGGAVLKRLDEDTGVKLVKILGHDYVYKIL